MSKSQGFHVEETCRCHDGRMMSASKSRIEGLDLLRGIAIALVLIRHAWPEAIGTAGIVGVVSFFALSGYLITGLLMRDIRQNGRVRYGRFYRNRALRLVPPLVLALAFFAAYTLIVNPLDDRGDVARSVIVGLTYTMNIPFDHGSPALSHLWTLATEEQFYIVWPLLLALGVRWRKLRWLVIGAAVASLVVCGATIVLAAPSVGKVYTLPTSWAIAMIIGAAAKLGEARIERSLTPLRRTWAGALGLAGLLGLSLLPEAKGSPATYLILAPAIAILTVALIMQLKTWGVLPSAWLRPMLALGTISYAAYLWNYPIVMWLGERPFEPARAVLSIVLTIVAATVSWWAVEVPAQKWKERLDKRARLQGS